MNSLRFFTTKEYLGNWGTIEYRELNIGILMSVEANKVAIIWLQWVFILGLDTGIFYGKKKR